MQSDSDKLKPLPFVRKSLSLFFFFFFFYTLSKTSNTISSHIFWSDTVISLGFMISHNQTSQGNFPLKSQNMKRSVNPVTPSSQLRTVHVSRPKAADTSCQHKWFLYCQISNRAALTAYPSWILCEWYGKVPPTSPPLVSDLISVVPAITDACFVLYKCLPRS